MKILVMGAGAVGGYFGARLAAGGSDVRLVAPGEHLVAIRRDGLRVASPLGDIHINPAKITADPATAGTADVVLFAVKLWDTEAAAERIRPVVGPGTAV